MTMPERERLDDLLDGSSPETRKLTTEVLDEMTRLSVMVQPPAMVAPRTRRWARPVVMGLAALMLVGGTAAATAATTGYWPGEWRAADATVSYTLPSGALCGMSVGNVQGYDPEAVHAAEDFLQDADLDALVSDAAIATEIARMRADVSTTTFADGSTAPSGYGTDLYWSLDEEYDMAVSHVVAKAVSTELALHGLDGADSNLSSRSASNCPGADW